MANPSLSLLQSDPTEWDTPPTGKTYAGINLSGQLVLKQHDGTIVVVASGSPSINKQSTSSATPVQVVPTSFQHTEVITVTGSARTTPVIIYGTGLADGSRVCLLFNLPATASIVLEISDVDTTLIGIVENQTGDPLKAAVEFYLDGGEWKPLRENIPAFTPVT